jgi:ketopantoate reductase
MAYVFIQFKPVSLTLDVVQCIYEQLLLIKQKEKQEKQIHEEHEDKFHDTLCVIKNGLPRWEDEELALRRHRLYFTFDAHENYKKKIRIFLKKTKNSEEVAHTIALCCDPYHRNLFAILVPQIDV